MMLQVHPLEDAKGVDIPGFAMICHDANGKS